MRRLFLIEAEKLIRSSVFWVAPIVLAFFLALMLFGFELYAAKNALENPSQRISKEQKTGSAVVYAYLVVKRMAANITGLLFKDSSYIYRVPKYDEKRVDPGEIGEFDYWGTFYKNLLSPKTLPRPPDECPCDCEQVDENGKPDDLSSFFLGTAYAAGPQKVKKPHAVHTNDTFMERLQKRLQWLMEPEELENVLIDRTRFNGLRFTYLSLYFGFVFVFPLITISVVAQMYAWEFAIGTMRTSLLRPVSRSSLLLVKFGVAALYLCALVFAFILVTLIVGIIFSGYGNLLIDSGLIGNRGNSRVLLGDGAVMLFLLCVPVVAISFLPLASLSVLLSYVKPEPATVIGIVSIIYFILFTLGGLPLFENINFLFFTTYMDAWLLMFEGPFPAASFVYKITVLLLMTAGVLLLVNYISLKKDIFV